MKRYLHNIFNCCIVFFSLLLYSHFFFYILWKETVGPKLVWVFIIACLGLTVMLIHKIKGKDTNRGIVFFLLLIPLVALLIKFAFKSQSIESERITILMLFATIQYYLIVSLKITERQIINTFLFYGFITLILQIYQQQPDSIPLFGIIGNDEINAGIDRNGVLRFYIGSYFIALLSSFYFWNKLLNKSSILSILFLACFAASLYFYLVRQLMAVFLLTIAFSVFLINNKKIKIWASFSIAIIAILIIAFYDLLFAELVEDYASDTWTTDIRFKCIEFTLGQIFDNPLQAIFGHGRDEIVLTWSRMQYDLSDIGIVGETYYYGIVWAVLYLITIYIYLVRYRKSIPLYIRLYFIGTLIDCIFIFPYRSNLEIFIWLCLLYICHLYVDNKEGVYNKLIIEKRNRLLS